MKLILLILVLGLWFFSCKKVGVNDCSKDDYKYDFMNSSKIDTTSDMGRLFYQINPGSNIVFRYTHIGPHCNNIADEGYTDYVVFQVPSSTTSFIYQDSQLSGMLVLFNRVCFCVPGAHSVVSGTVKGTKISSSKWNIEINVALPNTSDKLIINKTFTLQ